MISTYGDWKKCGVMMKALGMKLFPLVEAKLYENGELILSTVREHVDKQDLNWTPLSPVTVRLKGDEKIYTETGVLIDGLVVRKIKSSKQDITLFVGASPWKTHKPSGKKFSELMLYLEYGTATIPPRPIMRPTYEELKGKLSKGWGEVILKSMEG